MIELEQWVGERKHNGQPNPITLHVYPIAPDAPARYDGAQGCYTMYLDDGESRKSTPKSLAQVRCSRAELAIANDEYRATEIRHRYTGTKRRLITVERLHDKFEPALEKHINLAILHEGEERIAGVAVNGTPIGVPQPSQPDGDAWWYESGGHRTMVRLRDDRKLIEVTLTYL
jgi:alpha-glucosidase